MFVDLSLSNMKIFSCAAMASLSVGKNRVRRAEVCCVIHLWMVSPGILLHRLQHDEQSSAAKGHVPLVQGHADQV